MIRLFTTTIVFTVLFGITMVVGQDTADPLQPNSVWANEKNNKMVLTIIERKGESFKALFENREINGKINGPSISWLAKDVRALGKNGVGGDNYGILKKDDIGFKIDFTWQNNAKGPKGFFTLRQVGSNNVASNPTNKNNLPANTIPSKKELPLNPPTTSNTPNNNQKQVMDDTNQKTSSTSQTNKAGKILLNKKEEVIDLGNGVNLEMVLIPAGKFIMGSPPEEKGRFPEREKQHEVTISKPFYMGKFEITEEQYYAIIPARSGSTLQGKAEIESKKKSKKPMYGLTITDSVSSELDTYAFLNKLIEKTGVIFRLPTEAEWEYACRAGTKTPFYFGEDLTPKDIFFVEGFFPELPDVGSYKPNAFGLYDMHGGVAELCSDCYQDDLGTDPVVDPKGNRELRDSLKHVIRGGCSPIRLDRKKNPNTSMHRSAFRTSEKANYVGIRVVIPHEFFSNEGEKISKIPISDDAFEMVLIPAGKFLMGTPSEENGRTNGDEETQHEVTISKPYYLGKYEVTVEQWVAVMGKDPSKWVGEKLPITDVSWDDCQEFIKKLNSMTKGGYRLPTEAEWEYACRAGTNTAYSFGAKITAKDANHYNSKINKPEPIGSYKPNSFGLFDMHGNVSEWCEDMYSGFNSNAVSDPKITTSERSPSFIIRGGSWNSYNHHLRSGARTVSSRKSHDSSLGFRLAKDK